MSGGYPRVEMQPEVWLPESIQPFRVGQIALPATHFAAGRWRSLSIPRGEFEVFNGQLQARGRCRAKGWMSGGDQGVTHIEPVTLEGSYIRLVPLSLAHHGQMCEVGLDPDLWRLTTTLVRTPADMQTYIETALKAQVPGGPGLESIHAD